MSIFQRRRFAGDLVSVTPYRVGVTNMEELRARIWHREQVTYFGDHFEGKPEFQGGELGAGKHFREVFR